ncbi:MAG: hypothetical protein RQ752_11000, partial [Thermohalobaculum sp.]|nr:hypothetical protein [Thermohalobaculum sp.]
MPDDPARDRDTAPRAATTAPPGGAPGATTAAPGGAGGGDAPGATTAAPAPARAGPYRRIGIAGAGGWGTALAVIAARAGREVTLWGRDAAAISAMRQCRENA